MDRLAKVFPKIGSRNTFDYSNGNIYPITARPFGTAHFTFETSPEAGNWFYSPDSRVYRGVRLTHQPSPWVWDYGQLRLVPFAGETVTADAPIPFSGEIRPETLTVSSAGASLSLVPTVRGAFVSVTPEKSDTGAGISFLPTGVPGHMATKIAFERDGKTVTGSITTSDVMFHKKPTTEYFHIVFSEEPLALDAIGGGFAVRFAGAFHFAFSASFLSPAFAARNLSRELRGKSGETLLAEARAAWEEKLSLIEVEGDPALEKTFYSCLYRVFLYPRIFYEPDEAGAPMHLNPDTGRIHPGVFFVDNGYWDTFRTVYPLLSLILPDFCAETAEGILNYAEETGWLPRWLSPGEFGLMPGTLAEAVLADAAAKGLLSPSQIRRAYAVMKRSATTASPDRAHGRLGVAEYAAYGYVPNDFPQSVNETVDAANGDFCLSVVARLAGEDADADLFLERSKNYKNLFDPATGFFRGRDRAGNFKEPFDPFAWGGDNCECSSFQNSFPGAYDLEGLKALRGEAGTLAHLHRIFDTPPDFRVGTYPRVIHEMAEMAAADFGQCAISNQPSFHLPWLFGAFGERAACEAWTRRIATEAFRADEEGFPGDEDNGTTAAWFVFASLGFYPLCPGKAEYVASAPLFEKITLRGKPIARFSSPFVSHQDLV